jgi:hypothetical protein
MPELYDAAPRRGSLLRELGERLAREDARAGHANTAPPGEWGDHLTPHTRLGDLEYAIRQQRAQVVMDTRDREALLVIATTALLWLEAIDFAEEASPVSGRLDGAA